MQPSAAHAVPAPMPFSPAVREESLRDPSERTAFGCLIGLSIIAWLLLLSWVVLTLGGALLIIGLIVLSRFMAEHFAAAYIKTNAVEVNERQFPEVHALATKFAARLGKELPTIYVLQHTAWNAFASKLAGKRMVVLYSGALDSLLLKGNLTQVAWLIGHELGHHYAGHLDFWHRATAHLGSWFVWVGLWYKRRCEFTCDRYGLLCAGSLADSQRAICNMAVGAQLASQVDIGQAVAQWNRHQSEFFVKYRTIYSTHPHTLWRLDELSKAARDLGVM